ncbi:hypothetical protein ERICI_04183 [Paenibacillus larvae subsp. larvae]|uniref:Uncharacterized protein n=2 Tax=Paenibacillus larvae subsp. larvae TaxID=147375 RepID=V9W290_9BACL|nr:hypothetical protein ERIC2_c03641 [Paenibacillus larvae subsp. larvae DSM 25430]AQR79015.1 hypothetical protein BXP28_18975 [Paenibacillus larvae subsp. larvae]ETK29426.1 hypothetical protein ERIC1_1c29770 [Paenibacillus larvae subsp. larvae DSM 25719]AVF23900.1 hypothetical protein ERICI_04183 [Paenibacillus larvae subsp. larvae]AVG10833.1 hypothetical protein ERICII_00381 [Paenibacillus larvae subsp. larvae DSM 25430]
MPDSLCWKGVQAVRHFAYSIVTMGTGHPLCSTSMGAREGVRVYLTVEPIFTGLNGPDADYFEKMLLNHLQSSFKIIIIIIVVST